MKAKVWPDATVLNGRLDPQSPSPIIVSVSVRHGLSVGQEGKEDWAESERDRSDCEGPTDLQEGHE